MERQGAKTLAYAVRSGVVVKYLGQLCAMLALLNLMPVAVALSYGEYRAGLWYLLITEILGLFFLLTYRLKTPGDLQTNEALVITTLTFVIGAGAMVYPFMDAGLSWLDAIFEAVSGVTTTGLSTLSSVERKPHSFLFARAWLQWYGGLGIVVLSLALLIGPGVTARRLMAVGGDPEDVVGTSRTFARRVTMTYIGLTLFGIVVTVALSRDVFDSVLFILTSISTGGFSSYDASLAAFDGWSTQAAVLGFCMSGALPLALYYQVWQGNWRQFINDREVQILVIAILIVTAILYLDFWATGKFHEGEAFGQAAAMAVSAQTTTGFSTLNVAALDPGSKGVLILSMAMGGTLGSTAGGIKIIRMLILFKLLHMLILRTAMPSRAVLKTSMSGHTLEHEEIQYTLLIILLYFLTVSLAWLFFLGYGHNPLDALFEVVSAVGTVGLSTGLSSTELEPVLKGVLCVVMLLGRVEVFAFIVLCAPGTWFGRRNIV